MIVTATGHQTPIDVAHDDRRIGYAQIKQQRLFIERFQLVPALSIVRHAEVLWALPGGGRATTAQLLALARRRGWKRPRVVEVTVWHRRDPKNQGGFLTHDRALATHKSPAKLTEQGCVGKEGPRAT